MFYQVASGEGLLSILASIGLAWHCHFDRRTRDSLPVLSDRVTEREGQGARGPWNEKHFGKCSKVHCFSRFFKGRIWKKIELFCQVMIGLLIGRSMSRECKYSRVFEDRWNMAVRQYIMIILMLQCVQFDRPANLMWYTKEWTLFGLLALEARNICSIPAHNNQAACVDSGGEFLGKSFKKRPKGPEGGVTNWKTEWAHDRAPKWALILRLPQKFVNNTWQSDLHGGRAAACCRARPGFFLSFLRWQEVASFNEPPPDCTGGIQSRDNHNGNVRNGGLARVQWSECEASFVSLPLLGCQQTPLRATAVLSLEDPLLPQRPPSIKFLMDDLLHKRLFLWNWESRRLRFGGFGFSWLSVIILGYFRENIMSKIWQQLSLMTSTQDSWRPHSAAHSLQHHHWGLPLWLPGPSEGGGCCAVRRDGETSGESKNRRETLSRFFQDFFLKKKRDLRLRWTYWSWKQQALTFRHRES